MARPPRGNEFERAFQKLEEIVGKLEGQELSLDDSLKLFEEGIGLSRFCHAKLEEIEKKIETIVADSKGNPVTAPFAGDEPEEESEDDDDLDDDEDDGGGRIPF